MLYVAEYTWHPGTTLDDVLRIQAEGATTYEASGVRVRGYYGLVGGGAGYLLLDADDPQAINDFLVPSMGVMAWDVRQVIERDFGHEIAEAARQRGG